MVRASTRNGRYSRYQNVAPGRSFTPCVGEAYIYAVLRDDA